MSEMYYQQIGAYLFFVSLLKNHFGGFACSVCKYLCMYVRIDAAVCSSLVSFNRYLIMKLCGLMK